MKTKQRKLVFEKIITDLPIPKGTKGYRQAETKEQKQKESPFNLFEQVYDQLKPGNAVPLTPVNTDIDIDVLKNRLRVKGESVLRKLNLKGKSHFTVNNLPGTKKFFIWKVQ